MINAIIIDDHPVYIQGIRSIFENPDDDIIITESAESAIEALPLLENPDLKIVLLDLTMPGINGVEFCRTIKRKFPEKKVIILTGELNPVILNEVWENKADAILLKYCGKEEIIYTIKSVLCGERIIGADVPSFKLKHNAYEAYTPILTNREKEVLTLLSEGHSRKDIAEMLNINLNTIQFHCKNIFEKLNEKKLIAVVNEARKLKLID